MGKNKRLNHVKLMKKKTIVWVSLATTTKRFFFILVSVLTARGSTEPDPRLRFSEYDDE